MLSQKALLIQYFIQTHPKRALFEKQSITRSAANTPKMEYICIDIASYLENGTPITGQQ